MTREEIRKELEMLDPNNEYHISEDWTDKTSADEMIESAFTAIQKSIWRAKLTPVMTDKEVADEKWHGLYYTHKVHKVCEVMRMEKDFASVYALKSNHNRHYYVNINKDIK